MRWLVLILFVAGNSAWANPSKVLRVYSYDALTGSDSFGKYLSETFFKKMGIQVQFVSFGTAGEAFNQIVLEGSQTKADILMGFDEVLFRKHQKRDFFEKISNSLLEEIEPNLKKQLPPSFVPFDYGYLTLVYDEMRTQVQSNMPLKKVPEWMSAKQKIVLQDPRTSSLGLEFLVWTFEGLGDGAKNFWQALAPHILTVSPGWSGAYELFLKKQADLVVSYTTSPAYHHLREKRYSIKPMIFEEGHFRQTEGMAILKTSQQKEIALEFIKHVLGAEAQKELPTFQWMYPARKKTPLPLEFQALPKPKEIKVNWERVSTQKDQWIRDWTLLLSQGQK